MNVGLEGLGERPNSLLLQAAVAVTWIKMFLLIQASQERSCRVLRELQICDPVSEERRDGWRAVGDVLAAGFKAETVGGRAVVGALSNPTLGNLSACRAESCFLNYLFLSLFRPEDVKLDCLISRGRRESWRITVFICSGGVFHMKPVCTWFVSCSSRSTIPSSGCPGEEVQVSWEGLDQCPCAWPAAHT